MRFIVYGGIDYADLEQMKEIFFQNIYPGDVIIHGNARGADKLSEIVAQPYVSFERYPADWDKYGKSAGHIRNKEMLEKGNPDVVLAFPGGKGTENMVKIAKEAGVKVIEIERKCK